MLFSSSVFLFLFLPFTIVMYYTLLRKSRKWQNIFLFFVSIFFYAFGEPSFALVMLLSILMNYIFGLLVSKTLKRKKLYLTFSVIFNLAILFIFKYLGFAVTNINALFGTSIMVPQIALPLGISFFTFQAMSYVVDVYRGEEAQKSILNVGLYIAFFPQLIAGPIVRYKTVAYQILHRKENMALFSSGVGRFIAGLGKKVLLSNTMAIIADSAFEYSDGELSVAFAWVGAVAYTFQIFFDFGGYSDMAIGLGRMFGFEFLENFDFPYISSSITEFWRRWHISLGSWFRDYVYFPLGGSRVNKPRLIFNLFVVWLLTGVWHGANFTFILWGLMYFVLLVIEKLTNLPSVKKFMWLKHIYTLLFVILGWVLFRAESVDDAFAYMGSMFGTSGILVDDIALFMIKENWVFFILSVLFSIPLLKNLVLKRIDSNKIIEISYYLFLSIVFILSVIYIVKGTYNPFIYFNF